MTSVDDDRTGRLLRAIRNEAHLTQADLARRARVPRRDVIRIEAGLCGSVSLDRIRSVFEAADGRVRLATWWKGAAADRLLDARHARLVERAVSLLQRRGWETAVEVSFSRFGERGSVDVLAARGELLAILVVEVKSEIGSIEATNRALDVKERLAPVIAQARFGFQPRVVGRVLVVPRNETIRRVIARYERTMSAVYPDRGRELRRWLHRPEDPIRAIWFVSEGHVRNPETP